MIVNAGNFRFEMNLEKEVARVAALPKHLEDARQTVLTAMGVQLVSWAVQDYRTRSEGGTAGGVAWKPITASAIRTRLAGRTPWQRQSEKLRALRDKERPILEQLRKKLPKGDKRKKSRGLIASNFLADSKEWQKIRADRKKIREARKAKIAQELSSAKIGVDTGRLVNSLVYGVPALSSIRVGTRPTTSEGLTQGVFVFEGDSLKVGSVMKYAGYFDEKRPIFPPGFVDQARQEQLDSLGEKAVDAFIRQKEGGR